VPAGTVEPLTLRSRHLGNGRKARVYLPAGYAAGTARYPVVYLQDGEDTLAYGVIDAILDNLIAGGTLPPLIAVLVPPVRREAEYLRNPAFEAFFVEEVVPAVDAAYRTVAAPAGRVVGGASFGGLASASLALGHPEVFGGFISQSGAYRDLLPDLLGLAARPGTARPRAWLDVGILEADMNGRDLVGPNRRLRDALAAGGFPLRYLEVPEGHSWGSWRARLGEAIAFALGHRPPAALSRP
jgi:enterochelin esterase family protein